MTERIPLLFDFGSVFALISLDVSDIEAEEDSDIDSLKNFNVGIQIYLTFEGEYKEFTVIRVNLSIIKNDSEEHLYNKDDFYFKPNNARYNNIIWINYIYNYCAFHLKSKAINNFFLKTMFRPMKKVYKEEKTRYQIFTIRIAMYRTFILSFKYPPIYIKKETILKRC